MRPYLIRRSFGDRSADIGRVGRATFASGGVAAPSGPEMTVTTGLTGWYDAESVVVTGGAVEQMTDRSGNGRHFQRWAGFSVPDSTRPTLSATLLNGRSGFSFDGVDDRMSAARVLGTNHVNQFITNSAYTSFSVFRPTITSTHGTLFYRNDPVWEATTYTGTLFGIVSGSTKILAYNWDFNADFAMHDATSGQDYIFEQHHGGGLLQASLDGVVYSSTPSGNTGSVSGVLGFGYDGSGGNYAGMILWEQLFWNRRLTALECAEVRAYLTARWGL